MEDKKVRINILIKSDEGEQTLETMVVLDFIETNEEGEYYVGEKGQYVYEAFVK